MWIDVKHRSPPKSGKWLVWVKDDYLDQKAKEYGLNRLDGEEAEVLVGTYNADNGRWEVPGLTGYAEVLQWNDQRLEPPKQ